MTTKTEAIENTEDALDVRDIIARFEFLENDDDLDDEDKQEFALLESLLKDLQGNGGDEQWKGDWYPLTLIRDSYFEEYAQELAEDIGAINRNMQWPLNCIDWEQAAGELRMNYSDVEFDGVTYWYR